MKHEWRKNEKSIYLPKEKPVVIDVPEFQYVSLHGAGNPGSAGLRRGPRGSLGCDVTRLRRVARAYVRQLGAATGRRVRPAPLLAASPASAGRA